MTIDEDRFGTVTRSGEGFDLRFTRRIAAAPERVWAAITIPERIAAWFATADVQIELRLGGAYRLRFGNEGPYAEGEITAYDPPRLLEHTWPDPPSPPGRVRYELDADGDGCVLRLTSFGVPAAYIGSLAGWHIFLDAIAPSLDGVPVTWTMEAERELMTVYEAREPWLKDLASGGA
jgi:uncharacterized protein YndB with AHSA1/START domain